MEPKSPTLLPAPSASFQSRWFLFLASITVLLVQFRVNGYISFRSDHLTQIPLIYMQQDKSLFRNDWFLTQYAHFDVRFFHLLLLKVFALPWGLPAGILMAYVGLILLTLGAWIAISRRLYGSPLPGLITGLMAVFAYGQELGNNHLLEVIMIPRTEAYAIAYWGLYCVVAGFPLLGGVMMALGGYFQQAIGPFFALPVLIWLLLRPDSPRRGREAARFALGFVVAFAIPLLMVKRGLTHTSTVSPQEEILLAAYLRHPHHMIPHLWGTMWVEFLGLTALFGMVWSRMRRSIPQAWSFGLLAPIMIALLAVLTVFIEVFPVATIVKAQPYRMAVLLYLVLLMILSSHVLRLLREGDLYGRARAILLILALPDWRLLLVVALIEILLMRRAETGRPLPWKMHLALWLAALTFALLTYDPISPGHPIQINIQAKHIIFYNLLPILILIILTLKIRLLEKPRLALGLLCGVNLAGCLAVASFFWLPYRQIVENSSDKNQKKIGNLCWKYQFNPFPIKALERIGAWAADNTPKDALFLIPPGREQEGFHLWAKRAVFFSMKFFPYNPLGMQEWKQRFLISQGILDPQAERNRGKVQAALADSGGILANKAYENLSTAEIRQIASRYGIDYMITRVRYKADFLEEVHVEYNRTKSLEVGSLKSFRVYKIHRDLLVQAATVPPKS